METIPGTHTPEDEIADKSRLLPVPKQDDTGVFDEEVDAENVAAVYMQCLQVLQRQGRPSRAKPVNGCLKSIETPRETSPLSILDRNIDNGM